MTALFRPTKLARPTSIEEALRILKAGEGSARLVAGDTTLYDLAQHDGLADVDTLVDISKLGLSYVRRHETALEVGAGSTFSEIANLGSGSSSDTFGIEALPETAAKITPPQIRNMATIGGSICTGIPFLDMPTTVLALDAEVRVVSETGERNVRAKDHFVDYFQTSVGYDEIVTSIFFPYSKKTRAGSAFVKLGRVTIDFAVVNVASSIELEENGECALARIAIGAVANTPIRWKSFEESIVGRKLSQELIKKMMSESRVDFEPSPTLNAPSEYKKLVIPPLVRDSLLQSLDRANSQRAGARGDFSW